KIVWNPLKASGPASLVGADVMEAHGPLPNVKGPCIVNMDGTDVNWKKRPSPDYLRYKEGPKNWINGGPPLQQYLEEYANKCEMVLVWGGEDNGFKSSYTGP